MNPLLWVFLLEREYIELELRSVEHQGAHEIGGRAPYLVDSPWAPSVDSFVKNYY